MQRFTLTDEHIRLLRRAYVRWDDIETGAPAIDPKRPYGNSNVEVDIAEAPGWELLTDGDGDRHLTSAQRYRAEMLHRETELALQVILATGSFTPGDYVADDYRVNWRPA